MAVTATDSMFCLPCKGNIEDFNNTDHICVVGVFGKGRSHHRSKSTTINYLIDKDVFPVHFPDDDNEDFSNSQESSCKIEAYYDENQKVMYLHLVSVFDTATLCQVARHLRQDNLSNADSHKSWKDFEHRHARCLLYLFSVCHILVVVHPTSSFDLHYVRLFKALESIRQKLMSSVSDSLKDLPIPKEWQTSGRMCTPRLLFVCQQCPLPTDERDDGDFEHGKAKPRYQKKSPLKRLQHSLEDQIYRIMRKSRILTNQSAQCLFSVPANQTFVYVETDEALTSDPVSMLITQLHNHTFANRETGTFKPRSYQTMRNEANQSGGSSYTDLHGNRSSSPISRDNESLQEFLWQHVNLVLHGKGFDDNIGRNVTTSNFQVPTCQTWFRVSSVLYDFFLTEPTDKRLQTHWSTLKSALDLDMRFSESRCGKVLPLASRTYQDKLPDHYTSVVHLNKMSQAARVFSQHARGPAYEQFADQLKEECTKFWHNNRRLCEVMSLTGQHCIHPLHILPGSKEEIEAKTNKDEPSLPIMLHCSHTKTTSACNCGRKQSQRDDPFDIKGANYDFYQTLDGKCCGNLEHYKFPVFQPSEDETMEPKEISGADLNPSHLPVTKTDSNTSTGDQGRAETQPGPLSIALSLGQSGGSDIFGTHHSANSSAGGMLDILSVPDIHVTGLTTKEKSQPRRQPSTTEYLAGMLHTNSPPGLLPRFPSWSLVCLGTADTYKAAIGLDQPGFFHASNHLLPWDIPIPGEAKSEQYWPIPSESGGGRRSGKKMDKRSQKDGGDSHVRAYIGNEYECARGGRFICSGPDKMVKVTGSGGIKETANRLVTMDMPLYFPCACRSVKSHRAQLTRVFVVTPESAVQIRLNPRVQPGPASTTAIFNTGVGDDGILLPTNGFWVLRLPYVYVGDNGAILPPADSTVSYPAKLLKGLFTIKAVGSTGLQKKQ
ncbi:nonsense-mediated mRNA decay factor SMG8-like [Glandiceps talaboti]